MDVHWRWTTQKMARDDLAKVRGNQQLSHGCYESAVRTKQARTAELAAQKQVDTQRAQRVELCSSTASDELPHHEGK
jgi:hypothetical protein